MISVPNHRQPLSGNKLILVFLVMISLAVWSCGSTSHTTVQQKNTITKNMDSVKTVTIEKEHNTDTKPNTHSDTIQPDAKGKYWTKKNTYNLAFILPFSTDEAELNKLMGEENITGYQPLASLEFYEGALMALDTLKAMGLNLNVTVYNHLKDSMATALLTHSEEFKKMDLVIGPVFNEGLKGAMPSSAENEVYMISPLSPSGIAYPNPYLIMANAPIATQLHALLKYAMEDEPHANFVVVYRNDKPNEVKLANEFKAAFSGINISCTLKEAYNISGISSSLNNAGNYVFIASSDELYVNGLVRDLSKTGRDNNITLLSLQNMLAFESISLDYFENLHLHYPTSYWVDPLSPHVQQFNDVFTIRYGIRPSDFAYRGYDITLYFGSLLKDYGPDLAKDISQPNPALKYLLYPFYFAPNAGDDKQVRFIENTSISILKYENYRFEKVN